MITDLGGSLKMFARVSMKLYLVPSAGPKLIPSSVAFSCGMSNLKERKTKEKKNIRQILFIGEI